MSHIPRCHELFDIKHDNFGNLLKHKCRLVLQGNIQKYGKSYFEKSIVLQFFHQNILLRWEKLASFLLISLQFVPVYTSSLKVRV